MIVKKERGIQYIIMLMLVKRYKISNKYKFRRIVCPNSTISVCSLCITKGLAPCSICVVVTGNITSITKDFTYVFDKKVQNIY